jgi:hypothetical protein
MCCLRCFSHVFLDRFDYQAMQQSNTGECGSAFAFGVTEGNGLLGLSKFSPSFVWSDTPSMDELRFAENCPEYVTSVLHNETANIEVALYLESLSSLALELSTR